MRSIQRQYFLSFAVLGSLFPILSVYLAEQGFSKSQIGQVFALGAVAFSV